MDAHEDMQLPYEGAQAGRPPQAGSRQQAPLRRSQPKRAAAQSVKTYRGMDHMDVSEGSSEWDAAQEEPDEEDTDAQQAALADSSSAPEAAHHRAAGAGSKQKNGKAQHTRFSSTPPASVRPPALPTQPHAHTASPTPHAPAARLGKAATKRQRAYASSKPAKKHRTATPQPTVPRTADTDISDDSPGIGTSGKQPPAPRSRKRKEPEVSRPAIPAYSGIQPEKLAQHHQRAQMYALRVALGLPVDIPISGWGRLTQLRSLAAAKGITHIYEEQLLAYQPQVHAVPRPSKVIPQPQHNNHDNQQQLGAAGGQQQSAPPQPLSRAQRRRGQDWLQVSARAVAQLLQKLPDDAQHNSWIDLSSMHQLCSAYTKLKAEHDVHGSWPAWYRCRYALRLALWGVLGQRLARATKTLHQIGSQVLDAGITHMPLTCLLPFITVQYARDLDLTGVHHSNWWPPACIAADQQPAGNTTTATPGVAATAATPSRGGKQQVAAGSRQSGKAGLVTSHALQGPAAATAGGAGGGAGGGGAGGGGGGGGGGAAAAGGGGGAAGDEAGGTTGVPLTWQAMQHTEALRSSGAHVIDVADAFAYLFQIQYRQKPAALQLQPAQPAQPVQHHLTCVAATAGDAPGLAGGVEHQVGRSRGSAEDGMGAGDDGVDMGWDSTDLLPVTPGDGDADVADVSSSETDSVSEGGHDLRQPAGLPQRLVPRSGTGLSQQQLTYYEPLLLPPQAKRGTNADMATAAAQGGDGSLRQLVVERFPVGHVLHVTSDTEQKAKRSKRRRTGSKQQAGTGAGGVWTGGLPDYCVLPSQAPHQEAGQESNTLLHFLTARDRQGGAAAAPVTTTLVVAPAAATPLHAAAAVDSALGALRDHVRSATPSRLLTAPQPTNLRGMQLAPTTSQLPMSGWELSQHLVTLQSAHSHPTALVPLDPAAVRSQDAALSLLPSEPWFNTCMPGQHRADTTQQPSHLSVPLAASSSHMAARCGACLHCTDASLSRQPCLRSRLLLRQSVRMSQQAAREAGSARAQAAGGAGRGRASHEVGGTAGQRLDSAATDGDGSGGRHGGGAETDGDGSGGGGGGDGGGGGGGGGDSMRTRSVRNPSMTEHLDLNMNHQLSAQLQLSGQAAHITPHQCDMSEAGGAWRAAASGAGQGLHARTLSQQVRLQDSCLTRHDQELSHMQAANAAAQAAGLSVSSVQAPVPRCCEWCAGGDHDKATCPLQHWLQLPKVPEAALFAIGGGGVRPQQREQQQAAGRAEWAVGQDKLRLGRQVLRYRSRVRQPDSDGFLELQVRSKSCSEWKQVSQYCHTKRSQQPLLALQQQLTLEHRLQAAPAWLPFVTPDLVEGVVEMRQAMAWMRWGTAGNSSQGGGGAGGGRQQGQTSKTTQHDLWQSPEVCLALTLLAQEHAASLVWPQQG